MGRRGFDGEDAVDSSSNDAADIEVLHDLLYSKIHTFQSMRY